MFTVTTALIAAALLFGITLSSATSPFLPVQDLDGRNTAGQLAGIMSPTHVPEAFVFLPGNELVYRGAIDNTFITPGRRRPNAEQKYLQDAILAAVKGDKPLVGKTDAVGCDFESPTQREGGGGVTFTKDIAPIIFSRCTACHREGQAAPFPLTNYAQTAKRARQISRITARREMPPWIPDANHEPFIGERWLSDKELSLLEQWWKNGTPEGAAEDLPPLPEFAAGWQLGEPDLIVKMTEPFEIPADGPDIIRNFVIPLPVEKDKLVAAIEFHPGNRSVVHHAVLFLDDAGHGRRLDRESPGPGYSIFGGTGFIPSGALGGWSVGNTPRRLPEGTGRYLKKNSDLVLQVHYHPTGRAESDQSEIGIYFVDKPVEEALQKPFSLVSSFWLANYQIDIPAGESSYARKASYTLPEDIRMVGVVPHMHLLGKNMKVTATLPDGTMRVLINVPEWNYNWQDEYYYQHPFPLPRGTRIDLEAAFDNSDDNPNNPSSPPQPVTWGEGTLDEMLYCFFLFSADSTEKVIRTIFDSMAHDQKQPRTKTK